MRRSIKNRVVSSLASIALLLAIAPEAGYAQVSNWNGNTTGSWATAANWLENLGPSSSDATQLVFAGSTAYVTTNNIGAGTFTLNRLTVNNSGTSPVTLAGATTANTLTFAGTSPTIDVISGSMLLTGLLAGSATITKTGAGTFVHDSNNTGFTGTVLVDGGTFRNQATTVSPTNFNPVSIVVNSGGTYIFGNNGAGDPNLPNSTFITANVGGTVRWEEGEQFGGINLNGGTIDLALVGGMTIVNATNSTLQSGAINGPFGISGSSTINKTGAGTVTVSGANLFNTGALNIQEGVLATNVGFTGAGLMSLGSALSSATLQFTGAAATNARPLTVNAGGGSVEVTGASGVYTQSGTLAIDGALTKSGAGTYVVSGATSGAGNVGVNVGTLHLTGAIGHTGTTSVNNTATLRVNPSATASTSPITVAGGATLAVNSGAGGTSFTAPALSLAAAGGSIVQLELNVGTPTTSLLTISNTDGLALNGGTQVLRLTNQVAFANGVFTVLDYTGAPITSGFTLQLPGRTVGSLVYDTTNTRIDVAITGNDTVRWGGQVSGVWDVGSSAGVGGTNNWRLASNSASTNFIDSDVVTFDDTASGNFTVTLDGIATPGAVTVNNSANAYTIQGTGGISGLGGLTKLGTNTLTLATNNAYTGTTTVSGGTLRLGNGGGLGSVGGAISLADGTTLALNRAEAFTLANALTVGSGTTVANLGSGAATIASGLTLGANPFTLTGPGNTTFAGVLSGTGTFTKSGAGTLTLLANNNPFTGTVNIDGGTLLLNDAAGTGGDLSATTVNVNNGGTFQFAVFPTTGNTDLPNTTYFNLNAGGNIVWNEGEDFGGINLLGGTLQVRPNLNFQGTAASEWRSGAVTALSGAVPGIGGTGGGINKTTAGTVTVTGVPINLTTNLNVQEGRLSTDSAIAGATGAVTLGTGATSATLELATPTARTYAKPLTLNNAALDGSRIEVTGVGAVTWSGAIDGVGQLTKSGDGALILTGANTYSGGTTVAKGTLLASNATGSATGTGTVTIGTGATLGGTGTLGGPLVVQAGIVSPGTSPGILTVNGDATFSASGGSFSSLVIELNGTTAGTGYDQLAINGALDFGSGSTDLLLSLGFTPALGDQFFLVVNDGVDPIVGSLRGMPAGAVSFTSGGDTYTGNLSYTGDSVLGTLVGGNDLVLSGIALVAVPEPGTLALFVLAGLPLIAGLRRRK